MADTRIRVPMATDLLKADHDKVKKLFKDYEKLGDEAAKSKAEIFEKIYQELTIHTRIEEEIFYPSVAESEDEEEASELVDEAKEEHHVVTTLLEEISELGPEEEAFGAKMTVLRETFEHHIEEEEKELFSLFKGLDEDVREEISERLRDRKQELENE